MKRLGIDRFYVGLNSALRNPKSTILPCALLVALSVPAQAQRPAKVPRIGLLTAASSADLAPFIDAFRQGLRELGYVEGKNIILEIRGGDGKSRRLADLAAELVNLKVDVIVAGAWPAIRAGEKATSTIPIVIRTGTDPVERGLVASLARPGGNITGVTSIDTGLIGKRFELLLEVLPGAQRIAVLTARSNRALFVATDEYKEMNAVARAVGVKLQILQARDHVTIDNAFVAMNKERAQGFIVLPSEHYVRQREHVLRHASTQRLPAIYFLRVFVENGGLMFYGANVADEFRRTAVFVDKILKGAKPADLPVEQPTKFELVINLKTAKALGVKIPGHLLMAANKVIE